MTIKRKGRFFMDKNFIAERITSLRLAKGISEYKLSKDIGKCNNYINKVSSGTITPTWDSLITICDYFGITLSQFFQDESSSFSLTAEKIQALLPSISEENLTHLLMIMKSMKD